MVWTIVQKNTEVFQFAKTCARPSCIGKSVPPPTGIKKKYKCLQYISSINSVQNIHSVYIKFSFSKLNAPNVIH